jgi:hypothetical protein
MMAHETTEIIDMAQQLWPKANGQECGLLSKRMKHLFLDDAKAILEEAKMESSYQTLPLKDISRRLRAYKPKQTGQRITCYALKQETGEDLEAVCLANSNEGARVEMAKYIRGDNHIDEFGHKKWEYDPTDYVIFTDHSTFFHARHEILRKLDPDLDRRVARFAAILRGEGKMGQLLQDVPEARQHKITDSITAAIEKKGFQYLGAIDPVIEAEIEAEKEEAIERAKQDGLVVEKKDFIDTLNIKPEYDPEVPDDLAF